MDKKGILLILYHLVNPVSIFSSIQLIHETPHPILSDAVEDLGVRRRALRHN